MTFPHTTRVKASTLNKWLQEVSIVERESVIYAMLKSKGRIKKATGERLTWNMRYMRRQLRDITGPVTQTSFIDINDRTPAHLGMWGADLGDSIKKSEKLANSGPEQLWNLRETLLREQMEDAQVDFALRMWQDGTVADSFMGLLSLYGGSSTASRGIYNQPDHTNYPAATCADSSTWWACAPTQTYAGVNTTLGSKVNDYSNSNTNEAFPLGDFSEAYHFNTPLMVDYNTAHASFGGTANNWQQQWQFAFNAMCTFQQLLTGRPVQLACWHADLERQAKDSLVGDQRFIVDSSSPVRALGFQSLSYNGVETLTEFGVPSGMCVGLDFDHMTLWNWQDQLFMTDEDVDIATSEELHKIDTYCQLQCDAARYFPALVPASTAGT